MANGAKRDIDTSTFANGHHDINSLWTAPSAPLGGVYQSMSYGSYATVGAVGAAATLGTVAAGYVTGSPAVVTVTDGSNASDIIAAVKAWWPGGHPSGSWIAWAATASIPGSSARQLWINGYYWLGMPGGWSGFNGPTTLTANCTFGAENLFTRSLVTGYPPGDYSYLMDVRQRSEYQQWCANEDTTISCTCGTASVSGPYVAM